MLSLMIQANFTSNQPILKKNFLLFSWSFLLNCDGSKAFLSSAFIYWFVYILANRPFRRFCELTAIMGVKGLKLNSGFCTAIYSIVAVSCKLYAWIRHAWRCSFVFFSSIFWPENKRWRSSLNNKNNRIFFVWAENQKWRSSINNKN